MSRIILFVVLLNTLVSLGGVFYSYRQNHTPPPVEQEEVAAEDESAEPAVMPVELDDLTVFPVSKIIVSLPGEGREHYFVLDLALYGNSKTEPKTLEKLEPLVRNSVVAALSAKDFRSLRAQSIPDIQAELLQVIKSDFARLGISAPFQHVLVNRLVVQ